MPVVDIEIWSDVVCPWCYIGKRRFETALERVTAPPGLDITPGDHGDPADMTASGETASGDVRFRVRYRAYQLDPTAPTSSARPVTEVYAKKFGGAERAASIIAHLTETARADGIEFRMDIASRANTVLAHRLLWWAAERHGTETQHRLKEALLAAYFTEGRSVGDPDDLARIVATTLDINASEVIAFLESDDGRGEVAEEMAQAAAFGITGVPTYVIGGQWAIPGAQDVETFERVLRRAAERLTR